MLPVRIRKIPGKWWVHGCERCAERESNQQAGEIVGQREADAFEEDAFVHIWADYVVLVSWTSQILKVSCLCVIAFKTNKIKYVLC